MISDEELDQIIETAKPDLRIALKAALSGSSIHIFSIANGTNSQTGVQSQFVCFIAHEYAAIVLQRTAEGLGESSIKMATDIQQVMRGPITPKIIKPS